MPGGYDYGLPPEEEPRPIEYPEEWDNLDDDEDDLDEFPDSWCDDGDDYEDEDLEIDEDENFHGGSPYDD